LFNEPSRAHVGDDEMGSTQARRLVGHDADRRVTVAPRGVQLEVGAHGVAKRCAAQDLGNARPRQEAGANRIGLDTVVLGHDLGDDVRDVGANAVQAGVWHPLLDQFAHLVRPRERGPGSPSQRSRSEDGLRGFRAPGEPFRELGVVHLRPDALALNRTVFVSCFAIGFISLVVIMVEVRRHVYQLWMW
jgi:hypothetical protein